MQSRKKDPKAPDKNEIDLSSLKNIDAAERSEPGFEKKIRTVTKKKKSKFDFSEAELIQLPSGGHLYKGKTEDKDVLRGFIRMKPMTIKEEEILSTPRFMKTGSATRMIVERCCESDIDAKDVLLFDSNFLLFYLRKISYGDEYNFEITCSNRFCEQKYSHKTKISDLQFEELDKSHKEPIVVKLPKSGYTVKCVFPRMYHSEEIFMLSRSRKKASDDEDRRMVDNLLATTDEILDDEGNEISSSDWEEFFEALPAMDSAELRDKTTFDTGVDKIEGIFCPYCENEYDGTIPIGPEFFRF
tara:strand:+ start:6262 stop:7161 length:900 start_codon:yes stop_codon:yes gene_type:complete